MSEGPKLDSKRLEAARAAVGTIPGAALWLDVEKAISAYLTTTSSAALTVGTEAKTADDLEGLRIGNCDIDGASGEDDPVGTLGATPSAEPSEQKATELRQIEEMLDDGQGDDGGPQILPDFHDGMSVLAKVEACLFLLEKRRDVIAAYGDERLFDADAPMADGEIRMTAAEDVLAWLLIEKIGVPDDISYSPKDAQETIAKTIDHLREYERAALDPSEQKSEAWREFDHTTIDYVLQYGGRCRECADHTGLCPNGLPCDVDDAKTAIRWVLKALNYGISNGYIPTQPPAGDQ